MQDMMLRLGRDCLGLLKKSGRICRCPKFPAFSRRVEDFRADQPKFYQFLLLIKSGRILFCVIVCFPPN
ncbi:hypothetical protein PM082_024080 [Marasmius tenuissimus]|nr:hypothetical protein PM082_024080 [Marasmius tenuissimus]